MTQPEQNAAIGELVKTHPDAKARRAALLSELHTLGGLLKSFGYTIEMHKLEYPSGSTLPTVPTTYPTAERLTQLLADLQETNDVIARSKQLLADAGLPNIV